MKIPKTWFLFHVGRIAWARKGLAMDQVKKSSPADGYTKTTWSRRWWRVWWRDR